MLSTGDLDQPRSPEDEAAIQLQRAIATHLMTVIMLGFQWDAHADDRVSKRLNRIAKRAQPRLSRWRRHWPEPGIESALRIWRDALAIVRGQVTELASAAGVADRVGPLLARAPVPPSEAPRGLLQPAIAQAVTVHEEALLLIARHIDEVTPTGDLPEG